MRTISSTLLITTTLLTIIAPGYSATVDLNGQFDARLTSGYAWRGMVVHDEECIQPSITLWTGDFSVNVWGTWDLKHEHASSARTRVDTTLEYSAEWRSLMLSSGLIAYIYHDESSRANDDTFEVFVQSIVDVPLLPSVRVYYDFGEINGLYSSFAVAHSFRLIKNIVALDLRADIGIADEKYGAARFSFPGNEEQDIEPFQPEGTSLVDFTASAGLPVTLNEHVEITPGLRYMTLVDTDIKQATEDSGEETDQVSYDLTFTVYF
jgi:hypothetical protein